jgi:flavodoxin
MLPVTRASRFASAAPRIALILVAGPLAASLALGCATSGVDASSRATAKPADRRMDSGLEEGGALIILASSAGNSTSRIAASIAEELGAAVASPERVDPEDLGKYALIGFGSGIFDQMHHRSLLELADRLPPSPDRRVFIFSTSGVSRQFAVDHGIDDPHSPLRGRLTAKGCAVVGEFNCVGFNDNSFLRLFGGMNKGRPNEDDIALARAFARELEESL